MGFFTDSQISLFFKPLWSKDHSPRQIFDERGKIMHMMSSHSPLFEIFGGITSHLVILGCKAW